MEKMKDLRDLLTHEILDLCSAEDQIIEALPKMIGKARNEALKKALDEHLRITGEQRKRLDEVQELLKVKNDNDGEKGKSKGFLSGLFGNSNGSQVCKGMMGLIEEGEKVMNEEMSPEVLDAAVIASAQKIEHYEICGYGTARAYARELNLRTVADLLETTLNEEYDADDRLTALAVGGLNQEAEGPVRGKSARKSASGASGKKGNKGTKGTGNKGSNKSATAKKSAARGKAASSKKAAPSKGRRKN